MAGWLPRLTPERLTALGPATESGFMAVYWMRGIAPVFSLVLSRNWFGFTYLAMLYARIGLVFHI